MPTSAVRVDNQLNRIHTRVQGLPLPASWRRRILTLGLGWTVPYIRTSSVQLVHLGPGVAALRVRNVRKVQNHMGSVHASAMYLLAEAATGTVVTANLPNRSRFSVTHVEIDYVRPAVGDLRAEAHLDADSQRMLREEPKGRLRVPVSLLDEEGHEPARFVIEWAWKHRA